MKKTHREKWMIYGANGYTGSLIAEAAIRSLMLRPILAGRNASQIQSLADRLHCESRIFDLTSDPDELAKQIEDCAVVLHCAGPFAVTAMPMAEACLRAKAHYCDITGEISVFQSLYELDGRARTAGVLLLPGVGFDVVPTDCVARAVYEQMPGAVSLRLAFAGLSQISAGTMRSALLGLVDDSMIRKDGRLISIPYFSKTEKLDLTGRRKTYHAIPWGDVFTAFISTGIPNIEVYTTLALSQRILLSAIMPLRSLLGRSRSRSFFLNLGRILTPLVKGPDETARRTGRARIEGLGMDGRGHSVCLRLETMEGYAFTVESALAAVRRILDGRLQKRHNIGFQTPSLAFGSNFVFEIDRTRWL
jgi:short subunit dehydrogenase-like uncharacterized protein